jgi:anti-sigma28 factor (negative regulator of flagellin synthesis)
VPIQHSEPVELKMNARIQVLKQLVRESRYVVDPAAVAEAIIARALAHHVLRGAGETDRAQPR